MYELIKRPAHVALRVPDLDASVRWATTVMGMRITRREAGHAYLTHSGCHHSLQYIAAAAAALDHIALEAHDGAALVEYSADLYRVWDEKTYVPGRWSLDDHRFANLWGPGPPVEMMETATPQA